MEDVLPVAESGSVRKVERTLGRVRGETPGPTLVCVGGLHGNEPAGVQALLHVLARIEDAGVPLVGEFVAVVGNLTALSAGRRYLDQDLNRLWTRERVDGLRAGPSSGHEVIEELEQRELLVELERIVTRARGPVFVLDLHTTSGTGGPFATVADTLRNRGFAMNFPAPLILGLEELVDGTLLDYLGNRGYVGLVFESGQHEDPRSVPLAEAAVWIALESAGVLPEGAMPEVEASRRMLHDETRHLPRVLEMRYRHAIRPEDEFRMREGYRNFQIVDEGEVIAHDRRGAVVFPESARILMPLYQEQGADGFFVVRPFKPFWLNVSRVLRYLRADRIVHWLPGVRKDPDRADVLIVNRRLARWFALELFHLLGYRKQWVEGDELAFTRRQYDTSNGRPE